jgi:DNA-binding Xre family transcriptional regulator
MSLQLQLWVRIEEILEAKNLSINDLRAKITRNKNTFTNWRNRPDIKISDIEEIAAALDVRPHELFKTKGSQPSQLELPLEMDGRTAVLELECQEGKIVLRRPPGLAATAHPQEFDKPKPKPGSA